MGRVTLQTVADRVGVSRMTVSNAFSRPDQLSPALRSRILEAASELGYSGPDPAARALVRGSAGAVGVVLTDSLGEAFLDPVAAAFFGAVAEELAPTGLAVSLLPAHTVGDTVPARDLPLDAALIYACADEADALAWLRRRKLPLITVDREQEPGSPAIGLDERAGGALAAQHLIDLGHRDLTVFTINPGHREHGWADDPTAHITNHVADERLRGVLSAARAADVPVRVFHVKDNHDHYVRPGARALVEGENPPRAVICFSDVMAAALVQSAQSAGLDVPRDMSVVGYDDSRLAAALHPPLTTVRQDFVAKGRAAAGALLAAIDRARTGAEPDPHPTPIVIPVELVVRASTAPPA